MTSREDPQYPASARVTESTSPATSRSTAQMTAPLTMASNAATANRADIPPKIARRRGPHYGTIVEVPQDLSEDIRQFCTDTAGLSNRLPLASLEAMRAGTVANPHSLARRYLIAGRLIGQPKEWAVRFHVWLGRQIDCLWPMEATSLVELRHRALAAEPQANAAELNALIMGSREYLVAERDMLQREIAADTLLIAKIDRELEAR